MLSDARRFHWLRTENLYATAGINRPLHKHHQVSFSFSYEGIKVLPHEGRFVSKSNSLIDPSTYHWKHFAGTRFDYLYSHVNDPLVPTKGAGFSASIGYTSDLQQSDRSFTTASALLNFYQPLFSSFSLYIRSGGATLWGDPAFYQYNTIGGGITLRGYLRNRFFGRTVYYQQNELRFIKDVKSYLFNGKAGLIALYDFGRLWHPGETSGNWHYGIGGGILLAPFRRFSAQVYYTFSPEDRVINLRIGRFF
jgi:outer membrane protein assembly factor BamA